MNTQTVATYLQQEYKLRMLRISMDTTSTQRRLAIFTLVMEDGETVGLLTASMAELGISAEDGGSASERRPDVASRGVALEDVSDDRFRIPVHIIGALQSWLGCGGESAPPLWLRLSLPLGMLPAVPWERLLQPALNMPILRLPYQHICPRIPSKLVNVILCFGSTTNDARVANTVATFLDEVPVELAGFLHLHLFGSSAVCPHLDAVKDRYADRLRIDVHWPPAGTQERGVGNPWLTWMKQAMGDVSADVVHFVCRSVHRRNEGALLLSPTPTDGPPTSESAASMLAAGEIVEFLDSVGAWCVGFSSSAANQSNAGMRLIQGEIAMSRPGPVILHDLRVAEQSGNLADAYKFLFVKTHPPPRTPALSMYCHPILASDQDTDRISIEQLRQYTLNDRLQDTASGAPVPAWVASSQRRFESSAASLAEAESAAGGKSVEEAAGRRVAREFVLAELEKSAQGGGKLSD